MAILILAGAVLGGVFALLARRRGPIGELQLLAAGLIAAALIYVGLALAGANRQWLAIEVGGVAVFGGLAWLGLRASPWWLTLGWVAHVGWDLGLHLDQSQSPVGAWYPLLCVGFDLVVAGFLLAAAVAGPPRARWSLR